MGEKNIINIESMAYASNMSSEVMKKNVLLIVSMLLYLNSCSVAKGKNIVGTYQTPKITTIDYPFLFVRGYKAWILGETVVLNSDSTFFYDSCGGSQSGTWSTKNDSLILSVENNISRITGKISSLDEYQHTRVFKVKGKRISEKMNNKRVMHELKLVSK